MWNPILNELRLSTSKVRVKIKVSHLGVDAVRVVDGAVVFDDANAGGTGAHEIAARVEAHVTEALHDERLAAPARGCTC